MTRVWLAGVLAGAIQFAFAPFAAAQTPAVVLPPPGNPFRVYVGRVEKLDAGGTRYIVGLLAHPNGPPASGTIAFYAGDTRYDVRFRDAVVGDATSQDVTPTPIVVSFPRPIEIGAVVTALGDASRPCAPLYRPWRPGMPATSMIGSVVTS